MMTREQLEERIREDISTLCKAKKEIGCVVLELEEQMDMAETEEEQEELDYRIQKAMWAKEEILDAIGYMQRTIS